MMDDGREVLSIVKREIRAEQIYPPEAGKPSGTMRERTLRLKITKAESQVYPLKVRGYAWGARSDGFK